MIQVQKEKIIDKKRSFENEEGSRIQQALSQRDDYDVIFVEKSFFGFSSLQKPMKNPKRNQQKDIIQFELKQNQYEKIALDDCDVNVHALRAAINTNLESLREIYITHCRFYLSDNDAIQKSDRNQILYLRVFSELNLIQLIKSLKFVNLECIKFTLPIDLFKEGILKRQRSVKSAKVSNIESTHSEFSKKQLIKEFGCEDNCTFLSYEESKQKQNEKYLSQERQKELSEQLIWDNVQDKDCFWKKLYDDILSDIEQNLQVYKQYTKYGFNGTKLIIIGQSLNNSMALEQLQNLIHINCQKIKGIIFKDTGHIRPAAFTDLMNQLLLIPQLDSIAFFQSVLDIKSFSELQFFFQEKKVKYLVLHESFFLKSELMQLLFLKEPSININHHRFYIIDIKNKKEYEFCPYSFNLEESLKKKEDELLAIEQIYLFQRSYSKRVLEEINFYINRNISIVTSTITNSYLFENCEHIYRSNQNIKSNQKDLEIVVKGILSEDQISILNLPLINKMIDFIHDRVTQIKYQESLKSCKSYMQLISNLPKDYSFQDISRNKFSLPQLNAYLRGFSRFKFLDYDKFLEKNFDIGSMRPSQKEKKMQNQSETLSRIIQNILNYQKKNEEILKNTLEWIDITSLTSFKVQCHKQTFFFVNALAIKLQNLIELKIWIDDREIEGLNLSNVSEKLEIFGISNSFKINDFSFTTPVFQKCRNLKKLYLSKTNYGATKAKTINFNQEFSKSLLSIDLTKCTIESDETLNDIFKFTTNLQKLKLNLINIELSIFQLISFPISLVKIKLFEVSGITNIEILEKLGLIKDSMLEEVSIYSYAQIDDNLILDKISQFGIEGSLPGLARVKKLSLNLGSKNPKFLKIVLINTPHIQDIQLFDLLMNTLNETWFEERANSIKKITFQRFSSLVDFDSLRKILKQAINLEHFEWNDSVISSEYFSIFQEEDIPHTIKSLVFRDSTFRSPSPIFNLLFRKCQNLEEFSLYSDEPLGLDQIDFKQISINLKSITLKTKQDNIIEAVNEIIKKCQEIKTINVSIFKSKDIIDLNLSLAGPKLENIDFTYPCEFNQDFQQWGLNRASILFCINDFEKQEKQKLNGSHINYFELVENPNIHYYINLQRQWEHTLLRKRILESLKQTDSSNQKTNLIIEQKAKDKLPHFSNPFYYYTFLKQFWMSPKTNRYFLAELNIIYCQNVYSDYDFYIYRLKKKQILYHSLDKQNISTHKHLETLDQLKLINEQIEFKDISNQKQEEQLEQINTLQLTFSRMNHSIIQYNLDFLTEILCKENKLQELNFSFTGFSSSSVKGLKPLKLEYVSFVSFKGIFSKDNYDLSSFFDTIFSSCPNLKNLNLSKMKISDSTLISFKNINENLQKINLSTLNLDTQTGVSSLFQRCSQLSILKLNQVIISKSNHIETFPPLLFEIYMKKTNLPIDLLNKIVKNCQHLKTIDFSNSSIEENSQEILQFSQISKKLETFKLFFFDSDFYPTFQKLVQQLLIQCQQLKSLSINLIGTNLLLNVDDVQIQDNSIEEFAAIRRVHDGFASNILKKSHRLKSLSLIEVFQANGINKFINSINQIEKLIIRDGLPSILGDLLSQQQDNPEFQNLLEIDIENQIIPDNFLSQNYLRNIKVLKISECLNIKSNFLIEVFKQAPNLEIFKFEYIQIQDLKCVASTDFILSSLREFYLDGTRLDSYLFISDILKASVSLRLLSLYNCDLDCEQFSQIDFTSAGQYLSVIDVRKNLKLKQFHSLRKLFESRSHFRMNALYCNLTSIEQIMFLAEFRNRIDYISDKQINFSYFSDDQFNLEIKIISLVQYLNYPEGNEIIQKTWRSASKKGINLKQLINHLIQDHPKDIKEQIVYFIFLLFSDYEKPKLKTNFNSRFLIFSPFSLYEQIAHQNINDIPDKKDLNPPSVDSDMIPDRYQSFNSFSFILADLEVLNNKKYQYIFGYDKNYFTNNFPAFYNQPSDKEGDDIDLLKLIYESIGKQGILRAFLPLKLQLTEKILKEKNMNELEILLILNITPPAIINISGMSIQLVKSWYAINFSSPLSTQTTIDINYELIENSSIANFLTLRTFNFYVNNYNSISIAKKIKKISGYIGYQFFKMFSAPASQYRFDHTIIHLENHIRSYYEKGLHHILVALYLAQLFICIFAVWFFQLKEDVGCGESMKIQTYIMYGVFGLITFIVEAIIFSQSLNYISHLIPDIQPNCRVNFPNPIINRIKQIIMEITWINRWYMNYLLSFANSQLSRFDFLTNLGFLYSTYTCGEDILFILTLLSLGIVTLTNLMIFISSSFGEEKKKVMITRHIDRLYQISSLLSFQSVAVILDLISPTNSLVISKKMFNQRIIQNLVRIIFQDMPLIVIKALFLLQHQSEGSSSIYPIISSGLMFISSLSQFLSITPSIIGQGDFNKLGEYKTKVVLPRYIERLQEYETFLSETNFYETIKCVKSENYRRKLANEVSNSKQGDEVEKNEKDLYQVLRKINPNIQAMNNIFGNSVVIQDDTTILQDLVESPNTEIQESAVNFKKALANINQKEEKNLLLSQSEKNLRNQFLINQNPVLQNQNGNQS